MRNRSLVLSLMALVLFGSGLVTGRLISGAGPEPRSPSPTRTGATRVVSVRVPDVTRLSLGSAVGVLTSLGLRVNTQTLRARPDSYERGTVLSQGVPAGSRVEVGEIVPLVLSAGLHPHPFGGRRLVGVGGTCELIPTVIECVGGPLLVPLG